MVGQTIGKYRVVSRLGRGGMGMVYKAVDETLQREVAIKCLNPDLTDAEVLKRFRAEAIALARLNHPNIATLFELTEHDGQLLMVMEFVRGDTFDKVAEKTGPMSVSRAVELCNHVLDALTHAHNAGIVHRDLKLANLMLSETGTVKVMDFGLARMQGAEHLTNDGFMVGTPAYMSPEQVSGGEVDGRADLYAMGVVLYRLLTGQLPFKADSGIAMVTKQMYDQPTPVRHLRNELPSVCEDLFTRALAKSPDDRFQTAAAMKSALIAVNDLVSWEVTHTLVAPGRRHAPEGDSFPPTPLTPDSTVRPGSTTPGLPSPFPPVSAPSAPGLAIPAAAASGVSPSGLSASALPLPVAPASPGSAVAPFIPAAPEPAAPVSAAKPALPATRPKKTPVAAIAAGILVVVAIPAAIFIVRNRTSAPEAPPAPVADVAAAPAGAPAQLPEPPAPPPPGAADPAATAASSAPSGDPASASGSTAAAGTSAAARKPAVKPRDAGAAPAPLAATPSAGPASAAVVPPASAGPAARTAITFSGLKFLGIEEGKPRDRDVSLRLEADGIHIMNGSLVVQSIGYHEVIALFHSHSKEPRWVTPDGSSVPVMKAGGKFSFLKGAPDWVTVRTSKGFIPLRVDDPDVERIISELESRTGARIVRAK